jgi:hypothetical protein
MKTCFKCGHTKTLDEFYRHKSMGDGHLNKCKACTKTDVAKHRAENLHDIRAYDKARSVSPHRVELRKKVGAEWRESNPSRRAAQVALGNAVRSGKVIPQPCFVCGEAAEAHHPNYDAPLDVVWLCPPHHKQAHALVKKAA